MCVCKGLLLLLLVVAIDILIHQHNMYIVTIIKDYGDPRYVNPCCCVWTRLAFHHVITVGRCFRYYVCSSAEKYSSLRFESILNSTYVPMYTSKQNKTQSDAKVYPGLLMTATIDY